MQLGALQKIFKVAIDIETELARFYRLLSGKIASSEWIRFWIQMESEERNHAGMLQMQQRILSNRKLDSAPNIDLAGLEKILDDVKKVHAQWENKIIDFDSPISGLTALDAVEKAIFLEELVRKVHSDQLVSVENADAGKLFQQLAEQDIIHIKRLKEYRERLKN